MDIELLQHQHQLPVSNSSSEASIHALGVGSYLPPVHVASGHSEMRLWYEREVENSQVRDVNISCMNAYLEHGRRAWRALFTIIGSLLLI